MLRLYANIRSDEIGRLRVMFAGRNIYGISKHRKPFRLLGKHGYIGDVSVDSFIKASYR